MASEIDICNEALSQIRGNGINSFGDGTTESQQCRLHYARTRDRVLADVDWGFNTSIVALQQLALTAFNWAYVYKYPNDCLRINRLVINYAEYGATTTSDGVRPRYPDELHHPDLGAQVKYQVMNIGGVKCIVANESTLRIDYRMKVTDPNLFTDAFRDAIVQLLASKIAVPIAGASAGRQLKSDALQLYGVYIADAAANAMNERYTPPRDSDFITVRK